jgi:hypothetical protein
MRIGIGLYSLLPGGTEFQMSLLATELWNRGHSVSFYLIEPEVDCSMSHLSWGSIPKRSKPTSSLTRFTRIPHLPYCVMHLRKLLLIDKPDVIIGALITPHTLLSIASLGLNIPIVGRRGFSWSEILHLPNYQRAFKQVRISRHFVIRRTYSMMCNSSHVLSSTRDIEGWPSRKLEVIRNGWPEYSPINYTSLRTVYAGRQRVEKEFDIPGVERITGIPVWSNIGIYVHPTMAEGCSNSIGMAMAHSIPVIASNTKGNKELLGEDYQVLTNTTTDTSRWIGLLHKSLGMRAYLGSMCQARVRDYYSLKVMVDKWEEVLMGAIHDAHN